MKNIIIGFSYPKHFKIGAALIAWWTNQKYSHVYVRFESSNSKIPSNVYHAAHGMVHFISYENFLKTNNTIIEYKLSVDDEVRTDVLVHCMTLAGEKYGHMELIKIFISDLVYTLTKKHISFCNSKGYICSELVGKIMNYILDTKFEKPLNLLKPNDIEEKLGKWLK